MVSRLSTDYVKYYNRIECGLLFESFLYMNFAVECYTKE